MNLVSAIITTHNRCNLLRIAIESVLCQTYTDMECIVIDDASTDDTSQICKEYKVRYIYIPPEESRGGNYARNLGIQVSQGDYCAFLDDDDYWFPTKIEKQVELIEEKKCDCVYCLRLYEKYSNGKLLSKEKEKLTYKWEGNISKIIFRHYFTSTSCLLTTKKILLEIGGFDEDLYKIQEYELLIRLSQVTEIYYCHGEPLVGYRIDMTDKQRISNDPLRLPIARRYIDNKHAYLLKNIGWYNKFLYRDWMFASLYRHACKSGGKDKYWLAFYYYSIHSFRRLIGG